LLAAFSPRENFELEAKNLLTNKPQQTTKNECNHGLAHCLDIPASI
jgi:hypothetical protein